MTKHNKAFIIQISIISKLPYHDYEHEKQIEVSRLTDLKADYD